MVYGDQPKLMQVVIRDGFSQTGIIAEKYAITQTPNGEPRMGASLWVTVGRPRDPLINGPGKPSKLKDPTLLLKSLYNEPYWPRMGYSNKAGVGARGLDRRPALGISQPPETPIRPNPKDSDPFREQGFFASSMNLLNADGSVTRLGSNISD